MYTLFIRTVLSYIFLVGAMKLMGKRQIGQLELSEFVITMLLSELVALPLTDNTIPFTYSIVPIIILISCEVIISYLALKSNKLKKLFRVKPAIIINKGKISISQMEKMRIGLDELLSQLRIKNISDISDVEYAILEQNGQMSVIQKSTARNVTVEDLDLKPKEKGITHPLIVDGHISEFNLSLTSHDTSWLEKQLKKQNCKTEDVFLMTVDDTGKVNIIKKGSKK